MMSLFKEAPDERDPGIPGDHAAADHRHREGTARRRRETPHPDVVAYRATYTVRRGDERGGWGEIEPIFETLGEQFSDCLSYENEILAAEARGDLAYIVALEHTTASINGAEPTPYILRATTIFRREDGEWKVVHRHGDPLAVASVAAVSRLVPPPHPATS